MRQRGSQLAHSGNAGSERQLGPLFLGFCLGLFLLFDQDGDEIDRRRAQNEELLKAKCGLIGRSSGKKSFS